MANSPKFTFRMPQKDRDALQELAKVYGSSAGGFLAEMVGAMCSAEPERIKAFMAKLMAKTGEQLTIKFNAAVEGVMQHEPQKVLKRRLRRKKGRQRDRTA